MSIATVGNVREVVRAGAGPTGEDTGGGGTLWRCVTGEDEAPSGDAPRSGDRDAADTVQHRFVGRHGGRPLRTGDREDADSVRRLREEMERYRRGRARRAGWTRRFIPTGLAPIDRALPQGGLPCGAVTEILSEGSGVGAMTLAVRTAARSLGIDHGRDEEAVFLWSARSGGEWKAAAWPPGHDCSEARARLRPAVPPQTQDHRCLVLVDSLGDFYPPAMCRYGIPLDRLVVLRPQDARDAFWAVDQSLRCSAVAAVIAPLSRLDERASRRLQLAAESSGCLGLVLRSAGRVDKSFAAVRMLVEGKSGDVRANTFSRATPLAAREAPTHHACRRVRCADHRSLAARGEPTHDACVCRITLLTVREGMPAGPLEVDLHHETGTGPVHPVAVDRSAAKTG